MLVVKVGETFIPWRKFRGALVPEALLKNRGLSRGAVQLYAQLARYAGEAGHCYPRQTTLKRDFSTSLRTIQRWTSELVTEKFIRPEPRPGDRRKHGYVFVWHPALESGQMLLGENPVDSGSNLLEPGGKPVDDRRQNWRVSPVASLLLERESKRDTRSSTFQQVGCEEEPAAPESTAAAPKTGAELDFQTLPHTAEMDGDGDGDGKARAAAETGERKGEGEIRKAPGSESGLIPIRRLVAGLPAWLCEPPASPAPDGRPADARRDLQRPIEPEPP